MVFDELGLYPGQSRQIGDFTYTIPATLEEIIHVRTVPIFGVYKYSTFILIDLRKSMPTMATIVVKTVATAPICATNIARLDVDSLDRVFNYEILFAIRYLFVDNISD